MPFLSVLLNLLWIVFGGLHMALAWLIAAAIMAITIVGLPWCFAAVRLARYTLLPFGQTVVSREAAAGPGAGGGPLGVVGNLIWFVFAGWWLALAHLGTAALLAITIVGLPFAWAHLKLAGLALWPIDRVVVTMDEAERLRRGGGGGLVVGPR
jgi:uncharacterized membrane protein YccF (DUF307 family)